MNTLVINLTRLGDLLQTQPVLQGFAEQGRVGLVCLENFQPAARVLKDVHAVFPLPGAALLASVDRSWQAGLAVFRRFADDALERFQPDRVVNLTPVISARVLALCLGQERSQGFGLDSHGFLAHSSPWAVFMQTASANRGSSPFNVVDIFRRVAGLPPAAGRFSLACPEAGDLSAVRAALAGESPPVSRGLVGFQLGASEDRRRWPLEYFARLGRLLWEKLSLTPVLLGSLDERQLAERFAGLADYPFVDRVGRTSIPSLASVLSSCRLLVTNDTGTMHLAAGLGVPVAAIFLATAQPWDTGPYRPGSLSLEPDLPCHPCGFGKDCAHGLACRQAIAPDTVFCLVRSWLEQGVWATMPVRGARAWLSEVEPAGYLGLRNLSAQGENSRVAWVRLQRRFLRSFLDGEPLEPKFQGLGSTTHDRALLNELKAAADLMTLLASQGALLARDPRPALKAKFLGYWQRLQAVLAQSERLSVLGRMLLFEMEERSADLAGLQACLGRYLELVRSLQAAVR